MIINSNKFNEIISKDFLNLKAVIEEIMMIIYFTKIEI